MPTKTKAAFTDPDIKSFINFGTHDYIGARTLLRNHLPTQGAILGVTAIEKILKAVCLLSNDSIHVGAGGGHALSGMILKVKTSNPFLLDQKDDEFLKYLENSYILRYPDNINASFKIFIPSMRVLENIDKVFCKVIESDPIKTLNPHEKMYDLYKNGKHSSLIDLNVHFNSNLTNTLPERNQKYSSYKTTVDNHGKEHLIESFAMTNKVKHDDSWDMPSWA